MHRCHRGGIVLAAALAALATPVFSADTTNAVTKAKDDSKSAVMSLAIQAVSQFQSQQQATLRAVEQARQQAEALSQQQAQSIASLRRLLFLLAAGMTAAMVGLWLYIRSLLHALGRRGPLTALLKRTQSPDATALTRKGAALEHPGRLEDALACYEQALSLDASLSEAYVGKGNVLNRLERYEEALACFEKAATRQRHLHAAVNAAH